MTADFAEVAEDGKILSKDIKRSIKRRSTYLTVDQVDVPMPLNTEVYEQPRTTNNLTPTQSRGKISRKTVQVKVFLPTGRSPLNALPVSLSNEFPVKAPYMKPFLKQPAPENSEVRDEPRKPKQPRRSRDEIQAFMRKQKQQRKNPPPQPRWEPSNIVTTNRQRGDHNVLRSFIARKVHEEAARKTHAAKEEELKRQQVNERLAQLAQYRRRQRRKISPYIDLVQAVPLTDDHTENDESSNEDAPEIESDHSQTTYKDNAAEESILVGKPKINHAIPTAPKISDVWTPLLESARSLHERMEKLKALPDEQLVALFGKLPVQVPPTADLAMDELIEETTCSEMNNTDFMPPPIQTERYKRPVTPLPDPAEILGLEEETSTLNNFVYPGDRYNVLNILSRHMASMKSADPAIQDVEVTTQPNDEPSLVTEKEMEPEKYYQPAVISNDTRYVPAGVADSFLIPESPPHERKISEKKILVDTTQDDAIEESILYHYEPASESLSIIPTESSADTTTNEVIQTPRLSPRTLGNK